MDSSATTPDAVINSLSQLATSASLPQELNQSLQAQFERLHRLAGTPTFSVESDQLNHYLHWLAQIPWHHQTPTNLDLGNVRQVLDQHHYGLTEVKDRLLEYLAVMKLNLEKDVSASPSRAPILLLVGLVGTGKTTFAQSLALALGRPFVRLPFGGLGSVKDLRGQSRLHLESEPGSIIKALIRAKTMNPIILLDEIDRVAQAAQSDIMGVLIELLDPEQNHAFIDYYVDYPIDLSQVLFIATANGTSHIATAVLDRLEPITLPSYNDAEKIAIGQQHLLPQAITEASLPEGVLTIDDSVWPQIVRPLGYDGGLRTLQRTINGLVRKVALALVTDQLKSIHLTPENIRPYLPKYSSELI